MSVISEQKLNPTIRSEARSGTRARGESRFDWLMIACCAWLVGGLYLDGWAHNHHYADTTFFTPWHAVLYSGVLAIAVALAWGRYKGRFVKRPYDGLAMLGVFVFAVGGVGDLVWHTLFGIEVSVDALYSPTHLILAIGGMLMVTGPLRASWQRNAVGWTMVLSLGFALGIITFFSQAFHPFNLVEPAGDPPPRPIVFERQALGIAGILLHTIMTLGVILLALRRGNLPVGSMTYLIAFPSALVTTNSPNDPYWIIPAALLAGIAADGLYLVLKPSPARLRSWRLFAFATPAIWYLFYFAAILAVRGTWWSVHLWVGAIVLAGIAGLLQSYAFVDGSA